ncbi:MAG: hypothetical protein IAE82_06395 [Opitutaceae bacterium]|nr:hypothetical protein [Opitutaceae bacterium]
MAISRLFRWSNHSRPLVVERTVAGPAQSDLLSTGEAGDTADHIHGSSEAPWDAHLQPASETDGEVLATLADAIADRELAAVLQTMSLAELQTEFGRRLFDRWVAVDPRAATLWAWKWSDRTIREELLRLAVARWAEDDLAAAAAWAESLAPELESREAALAIVGWSAHEARPQDALRLAMHLGDENPTLVALASAAAASWANVDPLAASTWVHGLPANEFRDRLADAVARSWALSDAQAALRFLFESLPIGDTQVQAAIEIVQRAGASASGLVAAIPENALRHEDLRFVVSLWSASDPTGAGDWLNSLELGPIRDEGVAAHARVLAGRGDPTARAWVESVGNPTLRDLTMEYVRAQLR